MAMNVDFVVLVCSWNGVCNKIFNYISTGGTKNLVCSNSFLELQVWLQEKWPNRVSKKGLTQTDKSNWKELLLMQDLNGIARILFTNWGYLSAGNIYLLFETFASFCGFLEPNYAQLNTCLLHPFMRKKTTCDSRLSSQLYLVGPENLSHWPYNFNLIFHNCTSMKALHPVFACVSHTPVYSFVLCSILCIFLACWFSVHMGLET